MGKGTRACVVVPTIREASILEFLRRWEPEFADQRVIVVEDNPGRTFALPAWVEHYCWSDIAEHLGEQAWIIPRRTDCVRSFGSYLAYQQDCDFVVSLDDDCFPEAEYAPSFLGMVAAALDRSWPSGRWWNTMGADGPYPRGFPYDVRDDAAPTCVHHGLWSNIPDLDARTQARLPDYRSAPATTLARVPHGSYFPMCAMNLAFRREVIPAMYFLLMGQDANGEPWPFDRFGDIWAGIIVKKIADHLGQAITSGAPSVHHARASSVDVNLVKESPGYPVNELFWRRIDEVELTRRTFVGCYREIAHTVRLDGQYWDRLRHAMVTWADLFSPAVPVTKSPDW